MHALPHLVHLALTAMQYLDVIITSSLPHEAPEAQEVTAQGDPGGGSIHSNVRLVQSPSLIVHQFLLPFSQKRQRFLTLIHRSYIVLLDSFILSLFTPLTGNPLLSCLLLCDPISTLHHPPLATSVLDSLVFVHALTPHNLTTLPSFSENVVYPSTQFEQLPPRTSISTTFKSTV